MSAHWTDGLVTEAELQAAILDCATANGWWSYHTRNSRGSNAGWPDLVMLRAPEAIFVELKREDGRVTPEQSEVLGKLRACGLEVHVWRPSDLDAAVARLARRSTTRPAR